MVDELKIPPSLPNEGLLVGWSLEHEHRRLPIGFHRPPEQPLPEDGYLEPILYTGNGHLMTIASTGAGKGVGCILPTLLRYPGPVVVVDPKGENYAVSARRRRELGHHVVVLDPFGLTDAKHTDCFNPFDLIAIDSLDALDDIAVLAELIVKPIPSLPDPFWDDRARQLIIGLILYTLTESPPALHCLKEIRHLLTQSSEDLALTTKAMARSENLEIRQMSSILGSAPERVAASIVSTAQNHLEFLRSTRVSGVTEATTFDLKGVTDGDPISIYIVIPPDKLESHGQLLRLWIGALFVLLLRRKKPPERNTLLMLDEAAQLGSMNQLRQAITLLRGYGVQTWSFWQDLSQLTYLYPNDWDAMYNNCRVHQMFGFNNHRVGRLASSLTGYPYPWELVELDADEMLLLLAGDEPVIAQRANYLTDDPFKGTYDTNPYYHDSESDEITPRQPQRHFVRNLKNITDDRDSIDSGTLK